MLLWSKFKCQSLATQLLIKKICTFKCNSLAQTAPPLTLPWFILSVNKDVYVNDQWMSLRSHFLSKSLLRTFRILKENFTLIHEIWLLLINYNFLTLQFYDLLFLKHQKCDNRSWDIYVFSYRKTRFYAISE